VLFKQLFVLQLMEQS